MLLPRVPVDVARGSVCVGLGPFPRMAESLLSPEGIHPSEDTPMQRRSIFLSTLPFIAGLALVAYATTSPGTASAAKQQCGYVTAKEGSPPESEGIYPAFITQIDGKSTGTRNRERVDAGTHTLTISEQIPPNDLSKTEIVEIKQMKRREDARAYKKLEVNVEPGTTLRIGVRLLRDKLDIDSIKANEYWEPVVWETLQTDCP